MVIRQILDVFDILDRPDASGEAMKQLLQSCGAGRVTVKKLSSPQGSTDGIRFFLPGSNGKSRGGDAPTLCIVGRLGGLGARPALTGFVSDGDGALAVLAAALKLGNMHAAGDQLPGDVVVCTHICPSAPTIPHDPVPMMGSPISILEMNRFEVDASADAVLSVDTTKGNKVMNQNGFAISCTVKEGYILRASDDLLNIMVRVTGKMPSVLPISQQDITPYGNGLYHINSVLQPAVATTAPVVGVAITTEQPVAGCATGATHFSDIEASARFLIEVAKDFTQGRCTLYDAREFQEILALYGEMTHFQTLGKHIV